jgi:hypothetical protein
MQSRQEVIAAIHRRAFTFQVINYAILILGLIGAVIPGSPGRALDHFVDR